MMCDFPIISLVVVFVLLFFFSNWNGSWHWQKNEPPENSCPGYELRYSESRWPPGDAKRGGLDRVFPLITVLIGWHFCIYPGI